VRLDLARPLVCTLGGRRLDGRVTFSASRADGGAAGWVEVRLGALYAACRWPGIVVTRPQRSSATSDFVLATRPLRRSEVDALPPMPITLPVMSPLRVSTTEALI
jgi:hypothetical protein